ncbi:MAG: hypothetical protein RMI34_04480 [Chloroherpetonaceae bacterium]|nr:hypothetical protein [Chloroherpetonaceae bacterium]MCS7212432.1 hypothetical protein [Chloroherpetonaceae bacterium]MDW8019313.1 hypothetical protein [Chloroherpetonaceae bacterium]MDW8465496.1 hypothetical protein [Chloroherpetonaceae bacterium]
MKTHILILSFFFAASGLALGQPILGTYQQSVLDAPAELKSGEDVMITKDQSAKNKIWISGLIPNQKFYALLQVQTEDGMTYTVPKQRARNYQINVGCIVYDTDERKVVISLHNKKDCDENIGNVSVSKEGSVAAAGVRVGTDGRVSVPGVDINGGSVKINAVRAAGITYIGEKK